MSRAVVSANLRLRTNCPAAPEASSCWPVICGSPLARTRFSASGKSASVWFPVALRWPGSPAWSVAAGHSRSSSWPTILMDRAGNNTDTSTERSPTTSSTQRSRLSPQDSRDSIHDAIATYDIDGGQQLVAG